MINSPFEDIEAAALRLAPAERAKLAERLLASLDEDDEILAFRFEQAARRGEAYERGEIMRATGSRKFFYKTPRRRANVGSNTRKLASSSRNACERWLSSISPISSFTDFPLTATVFMPLPTNAAGLDTGLGGAERTNIRSRQ